MINFVNYMFFFNAQLYRVLYIIIIAHIGSYINLIARMLGLMCAWLLPTTIMVGLIRTVMLAS